MTLTDTIKTQITAAEGKAMATTGPHGVNVVPVSVVELRGDAIHLFDFFMGKTVENLTAEPQVALAFWSGLTGIQIKGTAEYVAAGELYDAAVAEMAERFPERTLSGVIVVTPERVYDTGAGAAAGEDITESSIRS